MREEEFYANLIGLLFYGAIGTVILVAFLRPRWKKRRLQNAGDLPSLAESVKGELARDDSIEYPFVRFDLGGTRAYFVRWMLSLGSATVISTVEVRAPAGAFFEARSRDSKRFSSRSRRFVEIVDRHGDSLLVTSDERWARRFLARGGGALLGRLASWAPGPFRIQVTAARFTIEVESSLQAPQARKLVLLAESLLGVLADPEDSSAGIVILGSGFDPASGRCPVCNVAAGDRALTCGSCRAPHHSDCWAYVGRCSIFGCGSRRAA